MVAPMGGIIATCLISRGTRYNRSAWEAGLKLHGYNVTDVPKQHPEPHDLLLVWNRIGRNNEIAQSYESAGARVIVIENGWVGKDKNGVLPYSAALDLHNGCGRWPVGRKRRWERWGIRLAPWRSHGAAILVLPQRGIGSPPVSMPFGWAETVLARLRKLTDRPVIVRRHPGGPVNDRPEIDWTGIHAAVTWGSAAGIKALVAGVPVFHDLRSWIGAPAARCGLEDIERPCFGDRDAMLDRLAWAQWDAEEIERGEPLAWLLGSSSPSTSPPMRGLAS